MSVKMERVLEAVKRMPLADRLQILVKAGLRTEAEIQQALERLAAKKKPRRKPKRRPTTPAENGSKPSTS
jgi:hypothetical protein